MADVGTRLQSSSKKPTGQYKSCPPLGTGRPTAATSVEHAEDEQEGPEMQEDYRAYVAFTAQQGQSDEWSYYTEQGERDYSGVSTREEDEE